MLLRIIVLAAALPGMALAADMPAAPPPPAGAQGTTDTDGTVTRFTLDRDGQPNGVLLDNGTEVHVPPHFSGRLTQAVRPGDVVHVQGWRTPTPGVLTASSLTDARSGAAVVIARGAALPPTAAARQDDTPHRLGLPQPGAREVTRSGRVLQELHNAGGAVDGALLGDGMELRMPANAAARVAPLLEPGTKLTARGYALETRYGAVMAVQAIGAEPATLTQVAPGPPPPPLPQDTPAPSQPPGQ